jgi:AcrR family transcriptional regulator
MEARRAVRLAPEARRAQLVEIGVRLVSERSFDTVSVDDVAREADISRGLLFHYFPTKRDFQVAVAEAAVEELLAAVTPPSHLPADQQIHAGLEAFIDYVAARRDAFLSLVRGAGGEPSLRAVVDDAHDTIADVVLHNLRDVLGVAPSGLLRTVVHGWIAFIEEATVRWLTQEGGSRATLLAVLEQVSLDAVAAVQRHEDVAASPAVGTG